MRKQAAGLAARYAHRGYHDKPNIPENSMAAFRRAAEAGLAVEFDVHLIADGSLVVFHDEDLERETGVKGQIEDYDIVNLRKLRLEGTDEQIPLLDEVLDLFEDTGLPLLVELKVARGNYRELARAVCERLDSYRGEYVIESFDPRALIELRRFRPDITRGQLVQNFFAHREGLPYYQVVMLTYMMFNIAAKPDFIAYRFEDGHKARGESGRASGEESGRETGEKSGRASGGQRRETPAKSAGAWGKRVDRLVRRGKLAKAAWTIRTMREYEDAVREGCVPIFEGFWPGPEAEEEPKAKAEPEPET